MSVKKIIISGVAAGIMALSSIIPAFAAAPAWKINAPKPIVFSCGGTNYSHTLQTVSENLSTGNFNGTGAYDPDNLYTWNINGNISANNITFTIVYTGTLPGTTYHGVGTIAPGGSISGTVDNGCQTFSMGADSASPIVGPPTSFGDCTGNGWQTFNNPSFSNIGQCMMYVAQHLGRTDGNVNYTAGFNRHAQWGIANDGNTAVSAVGAFAYTDIHHNWYVVNVTALRDSGNKAWFAGRVTSASQPSWVGNWLFAEVKDNAPDQIWGSFTNQTTAINGVNTMSTPADGPFNVTGGNLTVK